jgi:hypothetical protein
VQAPIVREYFAFAGASKAAEFLFEETVLVAEVGTEEKVQGNLPWESKVEPGGLSSLRDQPVEPELLKLIASG